MPTAQSGARYGAIPKTDISFAMSALIAFAAGDVGVSFGDISFLDLGDAAPVKRARDLRIDLERRIVVGDRVVELPELQIDNSHARRG